MSMASSRHSGAAFNGATDCFPFTGSQLGGWSSALADLEKGKPDWIRPG